MNLKIRKESIFLVCGCYNRGIEMLSLRISDTRPNVEVAHDSTAQVVTLEFQPDVPPLIPRHILQQMIDIGSLYLVSINLDAASEHCTTGQAVIRKRVETATQVRYRVSNLYRPLSDLTGRKQR